MKKGVSFLVTISLIALASSLASDSDPSPLQDTFVAIAKPKNAGIYITYQHFLNPSPLTNDVSNDANDPSFSFMQFFLCGKFCKIPNLIVAKDFFDLGLDKCDAQKLGGPLTARQPAEYKWRSGYPTPL